MTQNRLVRPVTRNVYLDTSVHIGAKFAYASGNLRRLRDLAEGGLVAVFDTRVDEGEIDSHIKTSAEHATNALKKFQREGAALRDLNRPEVRALFLELEAKEVESHLREAYRDFRRKAAVRRIDLPSKAADRVLDLYFGERAPFAAGEKKSEFPDALIITALVYWCSENDETMYVITQDKGMAAAAEQTGDLHPLDRLDEFLNLIVSQEHESVAILAHRWVASRRDFVVQRVSEAFLNSGFYLEDVDGDVENITIEELRLTEPLLVEVTDDEAVFITTLRITFEADISYDDPSTGTYDSEDKVMVFMERRHLRVRREDEFRAEVRLRFMPLEPGEAATDLKDAEIDSVDIGEGRDIPVSPEDEVVEVYPDSDYDDEWYAALGPEDEEPSEPIADEHDAF